MKRGTIVLTPFPFEKSIIYGEIGEASQALLREINLRLRIALQLDAVSGNGQSTTV